MRSCHSEVMRFAGESHGGAEASLQCRAGVVGLKAFFLEPMVGIPCRDLSQVFRNRDPSTP